MNAREGVLLTCEAAIKQYLLHVDRSGHFVIADLDQTHLLVREDAVPVIQRKLEELYDVNTYAFGTAELP